MSVYAKVLKILAKSDKVGTIYATEFFPFIEKYKCKIDSMSNNDIINSYITEK